MRATEFVTNKFINESQRFDFDKHRDTILRFVKNTLEGKPNNRQYNPFYDLIVGGGQVGASANLGIDPNIAASWKAYFQSKPFIGGAGEPWSQVNIGDQYAKTTGDDRTLNFYVTVAKDRDNILRFFKTYHSLASYLQPISQQYQTPIKFKTHSLLDNFIGHNDSFKVYYYDPKLKNEVVAAVKKWLSDNGISTAARSHEHGVDIKSGGGSFGQLLSNHVYDEFTKLIQTYGNKVTPEQYFDWLKTNLHILIGQVKAKENTAESWSKKYKKSINCSNPKGFSQRAHCAGRRARRAGKKTKSKSVKEGDLIPLPKGTVKVDVSDVYDWYKLGMHISDLKGLGKHDFGKGPPQTVMAFGSEPLEHKYLKYLKQLGLKTHDVDENFADGKKPGRKGLAKRSGVNCKQSISKLRSVAKNSTGEKRKMAHWCANMKSGKKK